MSKIERGLFYFLWLVFPLNLGQHFVSPSSYVNGVLVDYLIPTIYLSDLLIWLLFLSSLLTLYRLRPSPRDLLIKLKNYTPIFIFLFLLLPSVLLAGNKAAAGYKFLKYLEFSFLGIFIAEKFNKDLVEKSLKFLAAGVIFESVLSILQWLKQGYVFGYLPFGESLISPQPPFALVSFLGATKLRVYGTFPHPNVLGGYLAILLAVLFYLVINSLRSRRYYDTYHGNRIRLVYFSSLILGAVSLFLTFSRTALAAFLVGLIIITAASYRNLKIILLMLLTAFLGIYFYSQAVSLPAQNDLSFQRRLELNSAALSLFKESPLFGIGLNNFTRRLEDYKFISGPARFIQPVHNIYLLLLSESGMLGLTGFILLLFLVFRGIQKKPRPARLLLFVLFFQILFLGLFDHYPLTIQPGLFIFWSVLGFALSSPGASFETPPLSSLPPVQNFPKMKGDEDSTERTG